MNRSDRKTSRCLYLFTYLDFLIGATKKHKIMVKIIIVKLTHFPIGMTFDPVYIMIKKNTPDMYNLGITGLSCKMRNF